MEREPIIRVENLTMAYGPTVVLENVNLEILPGEVLAILGCSGCGKSTLFKNMIGLLKPARGRVLIRGRDLVQADEKERRQILLTFGVMFQSGALFGSLSLLENVMLPMEEFTNLPPEARELIARMKLRQVGLEGAGGLMPAELSGGMKKRAGIARALALDPEVVFLDEPSAGLDPMASAGLDALIKNLADSLGKTFVLVTHELSSIFAVADRVIMLDGETKGVIAEGRPADLRDNSTIPAVRGFFNRQVECAPNA